MNYTADYIRIIDSILGRRPSEYEYEQAQNQLTDFHKGIFKTRIGDVLEEIEKRITNNASGDFTLEVQSILSKIMRAQNIADIDSVIDELKNILSKYNIPY